MKRALVVVAVGTLCWAVSATAQTPPPAAPPPAALPPATPPPATPPPAEADDGFGQKLKEGMQSEGVVTISDVGDLSFFGGAINVPARRPSVELCGIYVSSSVEGRAKMMDEKRKEATKTATEQKYTPRERAELMKRATGPLKQCEAELKKRCEDTVRNIPLKVRKEAVGEVRSAIEAMLDPKVKEPVKSYFEAVLKQCPLES